ncbi:MAG TPA: SDR family NAD(P)-dependent oxidoreductase, partial [Ktedonobacterales bacterium]|nr:SDR family NAD(P)-dependent oxidoreductase [Ktedonobacterales bacterium]
DALATLARELNGAAGSVVARVYPCDARDYDAAPALYARILAELGDDSLEVAVYAAGVMPVGEKDTHWTFAQERETIETNILGAVRWLDLAAETFAERGRGVLIGVSSVAGERGRRGNSAYQASKAALSVYLESLGYRLRGRGVRVVAVKPGYVATPMTAGLRMPRPLVSSPERIAARIARACRAGSGPIYVPGYWAPIMWIIRHLPAGVLARLPI